MVIFDTSESQFGNQAVLEGAVDSFCSSPGLGGVGKDQSDAQFIHGPFELGGVVVVLESVDSAVAGGGEVGGSIEVEGVGEAVGGQYLQAHAQASGEVFVVLEESIEGFSRGIVGAQDQAGGSGVEPLMGRAIEEEHLTVLG